uniref:Uncharacterized protein ycf23 n=1 Tax=Helminthora furcellata TaxID=1884666 RepID=A0A1G4NR08_9FLOR|nr:Hypothetical protein ycf23 [Helminthora furcellata]SCW21097.1 Hypothetical protein ycf23 [Helminthora furcellata]SCW23957.1 Hypothetical protein ycf23 [Helminthora furcellata]
MPLHDCIKKACNRKQVLKTIIGIDNFNISNSIDKIEAADIAGSTYIDIAANIDLLKEIKSVASLPVCVSSISMQELHNCYNAGADMLEVGNFDIFYRKHIYLSSQEVFAMAKDLKYRVPNASICVTIPHILTIERQLLLAQRLEDIGVDMVQTEGCATKAMNLSSISYSIKSASATLASASVLSAGLTIPVIASSGISSLTAPMAISCGAAGVGIGSFFNTFQSNLELSKEIYETINSIKANYYSEQALTNYIFRKDAKDLLVSV